VIFTTVRTSGDNGYSDLSDKMFELVSKQKGFSGVESPGEETGITVTYWIDLQAIKKWKENAEHRIVQDKGRSDWYEFYKTRIAKVEKDYEFDKEVTG